MMRGKIFIFALVSAIAGFCSPGKCGETGGQREICLQNLEAIAAGDALAAETIDAENSSAIQPTVAQRESSIRVIKSTIDRIVQVGGGLPAHVSTIYDLGSGDQGGWIVMQDWVFSSGRHGYAGCARFPVASGDWKNVFRMNSDADALRQELARSMRNTAQGR